jgi:hypothetical protein
MRIYASQIPRKYSNVVERKKDEVDDKELVYSTNEGDVLISRSGDSVFIGESFDLSLARKLRDTISSVQPKGPMQQAAVFVHEPSLSMAQIFASFSVANANSLQRYTSTGGR